jgi:putative N6-adenine-specific DNA methylase
MPVAEFRIKSKDDLYRHGLRIKWDRYMTSEDTFSVSSVVKSPLFQHSGYPGLILKDSIADYFRNKTGLRPSVSPSDPDVLVNLHISNESVTVSLDSSVIPLFKRGYRKEQAEAPLNEVLAAGILLIAGWNGSQDMIDPMCGSGTFPIEAGLIASGMAPGRFRKHFGFMRWRDYDHEIMEKIIAECDKNITRPAIQITGSDISPRAIQQSRTNVREAGLEHLINLEISDFGERKSISGNEILFLNPPYGLRLQPEEIDVLYSMIGSTLKHSFSGTKAWIITPNKEALKHVGLKPGEKHTLYNGPVECILLMYDLYKGSMKQLGPNQKSL